MSGQDSHTLVFTPKQIADMEREESRLVEIMNDTRHKLESVRWILRGAKAFSQEVEEKQPELPEPPNGTGSESEVGPSNMMGTIAKIANGRDTTMSKKELKDALLAAGVEENRVKGPYFYVALNRLHEKGRITLYEDGTVGKAQPPEESTS
jgi:hypothetical protein